MRVLVVDSHAIYRRGLVASLELLDGVDAVEQADRAPAALERCARAAIDVVVVDPTISGGAALIEALCSATRGPRVVVCAPDRGDDDAVRAALEVGVAGYLRKDSLTQGLLRAAMQAAVSGAVVVSQSVLRAGLSGADGGGAVPTPLTEREQRVLALVADGHPTREVAAELCYSERTVKNVMHDVVMKLNARSRSQAIAHAVREGLI